MKKRSQGAEFAIWHLVFAEDTTSDNCGIDNCRGWPWLLRQDCGPLEETDVVWGVVGHNHATLGELPEGPGRTGNGRCINQHGIRNAGERGNERWDRLTRVDQGGELCEDLAAAHLDGPDFGDACLVGLTSCRFEVHHAKGDIDEGSTQIIECQLVHRLGGLHQRDVRSGV
jgi:hypothetical protein